MAFAIKEYDMAYNQLLTDFAAEGIGFQRVFGDELGWSYAEYLLLTHLLCATEAYSVFDGEEFIGAIIFLASDIHHSPRGIGSALLEKVESKHKGEYVALMTDSNCTVPFYEHRGFQCVKKEVIPTPAQDDYICCIYTKTM